MEVSVILTEERAITDTEVKTEKYFVNSHVRFPLFPPPNGL